jgi:hypothetical protein
VQITIPFDQVHLGHRKALPIYLHAQRRPDLGDRCPRFSIAIAAIIGRIQALFDVGNQTIGCARRVPVQYAGDKDTAVWIRGLKGLCVQGI